MKRILVTGAGGAASINFTRCLKNRHYLIGVDSNPYKTILAETKKCYLISDSDSSSYIDELNEIIIKSKADFVHAQPFKEVFKISKFRNKIKAKTFLPDHKTIINCTDKYKSYLYWKKAGLIIPETKVLNHKDDIKDAINNWGKCWIRAKEGAGAKGALFTDNYALASSWVAYHKGWGEYTVSRYLSPRSVTWMALYKDGELIVAQSRERIYWEFPSKTLTGITGITGAAKTIKNSIVDKIALDSVRAIDDNPNGIYSVDMTYDGEGIPNPTEINIGKFFTTHYFFTKAGLNFPEIYLKLAFDERVDKLGLNPLEPGLVWIRGVDSEPVLTTVKKVGLD